MIKVSIHLVTICALVLVQSVPLGEVVLLIRGNRILSRKPLIFVGRGVLGKVIVTLTGVIITEHLRMETRESSTLLIVAPIVFFGVDKLGLLVVYLETAL